MRPAEEGIPTMRILAVHTSRWRSAACSSLAGEL